MIYLYASRTSPVGEGEFERLATKYGYALAELPRGVVVGTVEIVDCEEEFLGGFRWKLANPRRLATPIPPRERPQPMWFHPFGRPAE